MVFCQIVGRKERTVLFNRKKIKQYHNKSLISGFTLKLSDIETINGIPAIILLHIFNACTLYVYRMYIAFSPCNEVCNIENRSF